MEKIKFEIETEVLDYLLDRYAPLVSEIDKTVKELKETKNPDNLEEKAESVFVVDNLAEQLHELTKSYFVIEYLKTHEPKALSAFDKLEDSNAFKDLTFLLRKPDGAIAPSKEPVYEEYCPNCDDRHLVIGKITIESAFGCKDYIYHPFVICTKDFHMYDLDLGLPEKLMKD